MALRVEQCPYWLLVKIAFFIMVCIVSLTTLTYHYQHISQAAYSSQRLLSLISVATEWAGRGREKQCTCCILPSPHLRVSHHRLADKKLGNAFLAYQFWVFHLVTASRLSEQMTRTCMDTTV